MSDYNSYSNSDYNSQSQSAAGDYSPRQYPSPKYASTSATGIVSTPDFNCDNANDGTLLLEEHRSSPSAHSNSRTNVSPNNFQRLTPVDGT